MKGVFLHVLGDALGSVVVIISAVIYLAVPKMCQDGAMVAAEVTTAVGSSLVAVGNGTEMVCAEEVVPDWVNYVDPTLR